MLRLRPEVRGRQHLSGLSFNALFLLSSRPGCDSFR